MDVVVFRKHCRERIYHPALAHVRRVPGLMEYFKRKKVLASSDPRRRVFLFIAEN